MEDVASTHAGCGTHKGGVDEYPQVSPRRRRCGSAGATGTIKAKNLNKAGTRTAVTITHRG